MQEITLANQIFTIAQKLLGTPFTYGRVDLVRNEQDELCLMELELHEPVLHLEIEQAATVLAENIITQADKVTHKRYALA